MSVPIPPSWPTQSEYQDAIRFPAGCLADPELASATATGTLLFGLPMPITGHFTNTYCLRTPDGEKYAVRLFLQPQPARAAHWENLRSFLQTHPELEDALVAFAYQEQGIRIRGQWYPLVKMPWIEGQDLHTFLDNSLYQAEALRHLATRWREVIAAWADTGFVHGDLQHGNILIEAGTASFRIIDYDAALLPSLSPQTRRERGHPSYQHPALWRSQAPVGGFYLDRFPALVIYVALRVLEVAPETWYRLDNGENLLFRREDLDEPTRSRAFAVLSEAVRPFPRVLSLVERLKTACAHPPEAVPSLADLPLSEP